MSKVYGTVTKYLPLTGVPLVAESRMPCRVDSPPPLIPAMWVSYSRRESLHTSETIEFFLDFSTGSDGWCGKRGGSRSIQIGRVVFRAKNGSYPLKPSNGHYLLEDDASGDY
jgi:hypothetical protein